MTYICNLCWTISQCQESESTVSECRSIHHDFLFAMYDRTGMRWILRVYCISAVDLQVLPTHIWLQSWFWIQLNWRIMNSFCWIWGPACNAVPPHSWTQLQKSGFFSASSMSGPAFSNTSIHPWLLMAFFESLLRTHLLSNNAFVYVMHFLLRYKSRDIAEGRSSTLMHCDMCDYYSANRLGFKIWQCSWLSRGKLC